MVVAAKRCPDCTDEALVELGLGVTVAFRKTDAEDEVGLNQELERNLMVG